MNFSKRVGALVSAALLVVVAFALVGSLPQPAAPIDPGAPQAPVSGADCPAGQVPVAPGAHTCIPDGSAVRPVTQPAGGSNCPAGQVPVAPGAQTCVPAGSAAGPVTEPLGEADCPAGQVPVAPGARTCIPKSD